MMVQSGTFRPSPYSQDGLAHTPLAPTLGAAAPVATLALSPRRHATAAEQLADKVH